jgi:hypothetical protein
MRKMHMNVFLFISFFLAQRGRGAAAARLYRADRLPPKGWTFSPWKYERPRVNPHIL